MYRKVLIASDGSASSQRAAESGLALARAVGAEVIAVSVIDTRMAPGAKSLIPEIELARYYLPLLEQLRTAAQDQVDDIVAAGAKLGLAVKGEVAEGTPARRLLDIARGWGADLIVLGTHGRTGLKLLLLGSTAQAVMHGTTVPVLLVR